MYGILPPTFSSLILVFVLEVWAFLVVSPGLLLCNFHGCSLGIPPLGLPLRPKDKNSWKVAKKMISATSLAPWHCPLVILLPACSTSADIDEEIRWR